MASVITIRNMPLFGMVKAAVVGAAVLASPQALAASDDAQAIRALLSGMSAGGALHQASSNRVERGQDDSSHRQQPSASERLGDAVTRAIEREGRRQANRAASDISDDETRRAVRGSGAVRDFYDGAVDVVSGSPDGAGDRVVRGGAKVASSAIGTLVRLATQSIGDDDTRRVVQNSSIPEVTQDIFEGSTGIDAAKRRRPNSP